MPKFVWILFFITLPCLCFAQGFQLELNPTENKIIAAWAHEHQLPLDSNDWIIARNELLNTLYQHGYLMASISQWQFVDNQIRMHIEPGSQIHWATLEFNALEFLPPHWVSELNISGQTVDYDKWRIGILSVLRKAQQEGYIFATYRMEVISLMEDSLKAKVFFNPGRQVLLDSIVIEGSAKLSEAFLFNQMGIQKGDPLTPRAYQTLRKQLDNLSFIRQKQPPSLSFQDNKSIIKVYLNAKPSSAFDILAGIRPSGEQSSKVSITGYVDLNLANQFAEGERIYLHLEKLRPRSQEVKIKIDFPFLLQLPFGVESGFELMKNDTFYSDINWNAGIVLPLGRRQYYRFGFAQQATNIISINKASIISSKKLPNYLDLRINSFTSGWQIQRLDFELNPRQGYDLDLNGAFSQKKIRRNDLIEELNDLDSTFNYASLYDTLNASVSKISMNAVGQYFVPLSTSTTLRLAIDAGWMKGGKVLFGNELFRLGGYARLRGFDEQSILAQYYTILTAEYRLLLSAGSFLSFFGDYAWVKNTDVQFPDENHPYGVGIGINLETKAGLFGMRIAAGGMDQQGLDFQRIKVHLGYINRF